MRMTRSLTLSSPQCEYQERGWKEGEAERDRLVNRCSYQYYYVIGLV